jgi:hypothetical protein
MPKTIMMFPLFRAGVHYLGCGTLTLTPGQLTAGLNL